MENFDSQLQVTVREQENYPEQSGLSEYNTENIAFPVLISVPHAGRIYPEELMQNLNIPPAELLRLEDRYADRLASSAISTGFPAIVAHKPRAWIDLNRQSSEIDPDIVDGISASDLPAPTRKVRGGLGLIPRRLNTVGNLWKNCWEIDDIRSRIENYHEPYHRAIGSLLEQIRDKFGVALLLDVHSMPPLDITYAQRKEAGDHSGKDNVVIGDRFGRSAGGRYTELAMEFLKECGFFAQLNHPYSGGYVLERHGRPDKAIHALQVEIDRACYLNQSLTEPSENLTNISEKIERLAQVLARQLAGQLLLAAE